MVHGDMNLGYAYGYYGYVSPLSYFVDHGITYLLITSLPHEVGLTEYVCTHLFIVVFLAADLDYMLEEFE
jgi:hypothetical protein